MARGRWRKEMERGDEERDGEMEMERGRWRERGGEMEMERER